MTNTFDSFGPFLGAELTPLPALSSVVLDATAEETLEQEENSLNSLNPHGDRELFERALIGLPGKIVRAVDPYTEADPAAVLVQLLTMFGNYVGLSSGTKRGNKTHYPRIYVAIVGRTSGARKGTSWEVVKGLLARADEEYTKKCIMKGASTGEGIIAAFQGMAGNKRLLLVEEEFASILARKSREGNVLSQFLREGYDNETFQVGTRNDPLKVDDAHLSAIVQITNEELLATLKSVDYTNGFTNRIMWMQVNYSKLLAHGSVVPEAIEEELAQQLRTALDRAQSLGPVVLDEGAEQYWGEIYAELRQERGGILGALTSRAEVITLRLALAYALFEGSAVIKQDHLFAAYSLWSYSFGCVQEIFCPGEVSAFAERVYSVLQDEWMTRTQISDALGRHLESKQISAAIEELASYSRIEVEVEGTGGRSRQLVRKKAK